MHSNLVYLNTCFLKVFSFQILPKTSPKLAKSTGIEKCNVPVLPVYENSKAKESQRIVLNKKRDEPGDSAVVVLGPCSSLVTKREAKDTNKKRNETHTQTYNGFSWPKLQNTTH